MRKQRTSRLTLRLCAAIALMPLLAGCGGTWSDDPGNFKRIFGFTQPSDVQVLHSLYWKSPHFTTEYSYFIELRGPEKFVRGLTAPELMTKPLAGQDTSKSCASERPAWFAPRLLQRYTLWVPYSGTYLILQDKDDGTVFVCDQLL